MSRTLVYTKEKILNKAFEVLKKDGFEGVTARNIGKALGCSTTPIYTEYSSMENLKEELIEKIIKEIKIYFNRDYTEDKYLNISIGFCLFAQNKKKIFSLICKEKYFFDRLKEIIEEDELNKKQENFFKNWWIFIYGYANLMNNSCINLTEGELKNILIINSDILKKLN